jgi:signal transduction histidine kinase
MRESGFREPQIAGGGSMTRIRSISLQAALFQALVMTLAFLVITLLQGRTVRSRAYEDLANTGVNVLTALTEMISENPGLYLAGTLQPVLQRYQRRIANIERVVAVDLSGLVIADSRIELIGKRMANPEIRKCMEGQLSIQRTIQREHRNIMQVLIPVDGPYDATRKSSILGALMIEIGSEFVDSRVAADTVRTAWISGGLLLAALCMQVVLIRRLVIRPLQHLSSVAKRFEQGEFSARVPVRGATELGLLAGSFNSMAEKIEKHSRELEARIEDLNQAHRRQKELLTELDSANRELNDFAYVVSHDLKAPLRAIGSLAHWISDDYTDKLDEAGREQLGLLRSRTNRMHDLINGILQYSRLGRIRENKQEIDLHRLAAEVIDLLAPPPNVRVSVETPLPIIVAEKTRIAQVFQNLLSNAIKFSDKEFTEIRIGCGNQDGFWIFSVADNGPGIPEKHFQRIFQIFQTLRPRDQQESTGVGLAVVKKVIEGHGGTVWVESQIGHGSTFFFRLPQAGALANQAT